MSENSLEAVRKRGKVCDGLTPESGGREAKSSWKSRRFRRETRAANPDLSIWWLRVRVASSAQAQTVREARAIRPTPLPHLLTGAGPRLYRHPCRCAALEPRSYGEATAERQREAFRTGSSYDSSAGAKPILKYGHITSLDPTCLTALIPPSCDMTNATDGSMLETKR